MITIDEHTVDLSLLPEKATILDGGCRGFGFANYFRELGHDVLAVDIDDLPEGRDHYKKCGLACVNGKAYVSNDKDPQARRLINPKPFGNDYHILAGNEVYILTIQQIEASYGKKFDLIKLDIEGAEFNILDQGKHPMAKQISVEFHAHCGQTKEELDNLLTRLSEWYEIRNQVWEKRHGCSENYWDVLLIAK